MKIRRLLGLAALGGGIYWMQKKRGGDMSFASIKENVRGLVDDLMNKANIKPAEEASTSSARPATGTGAAYGGTAGTYTGSAGSYSGGSGYSGSGNFGGRGGFGGGNGGTRH